MKKLLASVCALALSCVVAVAQMPLFGTNAIPTGFCQATVTTAILLSTACNIPVGSKYFMVSVDTANVRYRDDGTAPTASSGVQWASSATQPYWYAGQLSAIQLVAVSGSPVINVSFYK